MCPKNGSVEPARPCCFPATEVSFPTCFYDAKRPRAAFPCHPVWWPGHAVSPLRECHFRLVVMMRRGHEQLFHAIPFCGRRLGVGFDGFGVKSCQNKPKPQFFIVDSSATFAPGARQAMLFPRCESVISDLFL